MEFCTDSIIAPAAMSMSAPGWLASSEDREHVRARCNPAGESPQGSNEPSLTDAAL
ncbi:hypothetical protein K4K94_19190 (plasmid) [Phaeobacter inhibens]|uniref:hypothetical protein n=1 Tax=Phaeobacter inhibens TaxID=221822 RepID=UPI0021A44055|nr:hypothetical protein [Phaeobacter inhibens]UWS06073.1 hypothetical protein K4K94_19190 [Phaeobacter inhibens]